MKAQGKTIVIFRTYKKEGDVIALFPEFPADSSRHHCLSYQSIGQHGAASCCIDPDTRPATKKEAETLAKELRQIGYRLEVRKRLSRAMDSRRISSMQSAAS